MHRRRHTTDARNVVLGAQARGAGVFGSRRLRAERARDHCPQAQTRSPAFRTNGESLRAENIWGCNPLPVSPLPVSPLENIAGELFVKFQ